MRKFTIFTHAIALIAWLFISLQIVKANEPPAPVDFFFENFDNTGATGFEAPIPSDWSSLAMVSNSSVVIRNDGGGGPWSPPYHARLLNGANTSGNVMLISPLVNNLENSWVRFFAVTSTGTPTLQVGFMTDKENPMTFTSLATITLNNVYKQYSVSFKDAEGFEFPENAYIVFRHGMSANNQFLFVDDVYYEEQPTGPVFNVSTTELDFGDMVYQNETASKPLVLSNFGVDEDITINRTDITISGADADFFEVAYPNDDDPIVLQPVGSPYTLTVNFSPTELREYNATLSIEDNINGDKAITTISLRGSGYDPTVTPEISYDFIGTFPPLDWMIMQGALGPEPVTLTDASNLAVNLRWAHTKFGNQNDLPENNAASVVTFNNRHSWLITPPIDLGGEDTDYLLNFDLALTASFNANPGTLGTNQTFNIVISTDGGTTWSEDGIIKTWTASDPISNTGQKVGIDLSDYTGVVKIGFYARGIGFGSARVHVTNVAIENYQTNTLTINLIDEDNNPVNDATITLGDEVLTEGVNGAYSFELLNGIYGYNISKPGHDVISGNVAVESEDVTVNYTLVRSVAELVSNPEALFVGIAQVDDIIQKSLRITNTQFSTAILNEGDISFEGADAELFSFSLANEGLEYPIQLENNQFFDLIVSFDPINPSDAETLLKVQYEYDYFGNDNNISEELEVNITANAYDFFTTFSEDFDSYTPPAIPQPWSSLIDGPDGSPAVVVLATSGIPFSSPNHVELNAGNTIDGTADLFLISPKVNNLTNSRVRLYSKMNTQTSSMDVGYMTDVNDPESFTLVETVGFNNVYSQYAVSFVNDALKEDEKNIPDEAFVAFRWNVLRFRRAYLDNIIYEEQPTNPLLTPNKDVVDFGNGLYIGETFNQTLVISNTGIDTLTLNLNDFQIAGEDADFFSLNFSDALEWPIKLGTFESFTVPLTFSPVEPIVYNAFLEIEDNVGEKAINQIPLTGEGYDPTLTPPFLFDFVGTFPPVDWTRWQGELKDGTEGNETVLVPNATIWFHGKFGNQTDLPENNSAKMDLSASFRQHWITTPPIDLGEGDTEYLLSFDFALTGRNNTNPVTLGDPELQYFAVVISPDNGETWIQGNIIKRIDANDNVTPEGQRFGVLLVDEDGEPFTGSVKLGFYGHTRLTTGGDIHLTNISVAEAEYYSVTFNIEDSDGNAINDAIVTFNNDVISEAPYTFENLIVGNYDYHISRIGYLSAEGTVTVADEDVTLDIVLPDGFSVSFNVTEGTEPVANAIVNIFSEDDLPVASIATDENGTAEVVLADGTYSYNVTAFGYLPFEDGIFILIDEDISVDVSLVKPAPMALPFFEDFNDAELPEFWIVQDQDDHAAPLSWEFIESYGSNDNTLDGTPFAFIDSDGAGSGAGILNSMLYTPAIDAGNIDGGLKLSFEHYYRHLNDNFGRVDVWDGNQWHNLVEFNSNTGSWTESAFFTADITPYANDELRVRFHFNDDGGWNWFWAVDNVSITEEPLFNLALQVNPAGWGEVTGAGDFIEGASVPVTATANPGYVFLNWTDVDETVVSTEPDNIITMPGNDLTLTANFILGPADPLVLTTVVSKTGEDLPPQIGDGNNARAADLFQNRYIIVPSREDGTNVWVWDILSPHLDPIALDTGTGIIEGGLFTVNYVRIVGDDIYVSNMTLGSNEDHPFRVYRWSGLDASPEVVLSTSGNWGRLGDAFSIIGDPANNGSIIAHVNSGGEGQRTFKKWNFVNGELQNLENPEVISIDAEFNMNSYGVLNPIPGEEDLYLTTGNSMGIAIVDLDGEVHAYLPTSTITAFSYDPNIFEFEGKRFLTYTQNLVGNTEDGARYVVVDITDGEDAVEAFSYLTDSNVFNSRKAREVIFGPANGFHSSTNRVYFTDDGDLMILAYVLSRGLVLETSGTLPATYALTVEAAPAEGGTVTGGGDYYEGATVPVTATPADGYEFISWTIGTDVVSEEAAFSYTMPAAATTLTANFEEIPIFDVPTLAELRTKPADGTLYRYTGDAVIVAMDGFRNRKFLQDETAAIMIDDNPGVITPEYDLYDVITNVVGKINIFNQLVQFQPQEDTEPAEENTPVDPYDFTIPDLTSDDQAKLVKLHNVTFTDITEGQVFANGTNYTITDGENNLTVRTDFWNVDYIGEEIPVTPQNITGVIIQFGSNLQLVPRFAADFEDYVAPETFAVTFNVNMITADNFDPASDVVYVTGSMLGWAEPGSDPDNQTMERVGDTWVWTKTLHLEAGEYAYKYFLNAGWDGGEWGGGDDRMVTVTEDIVLNDFWGSMDPLYELTLVADPADGGTVAGAGLYAEGEAVTVTATAATGFVFINWTLGTDVVSTDASFSYTMPAANVTLTANFDVQPSVGEITTVEINVFPNPARDNFNITANSMIRGIVIADITGKVIYNDIINDTQVRIDNVLDTGIYLLHIQTDEGVFVRKLQIQK